MLILLLACVDLPTEPSSPGVDSEEDPSVPSVLPPPSLPSPPTTDVAPLVGDPEVGHLTFLMPPQPTGGGFNSYQCVLCHKTGNQPNPDYGVDLYTRVPFRTDAQIAAYSRHGGGNMPPPSPGMYSETDVADLVAYMRWEYGCGAQDPCPPEPSEIATVTDWSGGDPALGAPVFEELCAGCHGASGRGTELGSDLRTAAQNLHPEILAHTVFEGTRRLGDEGMEGMVTPGPTDAETWHLVAYIRTEFGGHSAAD